MDWYQTVFEVIDMRSFSNLWFWMAVAVVWSTASHYGLGVPYDMVLRARRHGGEAAADLETMVEINVRRLMHIQATAGLWLVGFGAFGVTALALMGFLYDLEFAQAVLLIAAPMTLVFALTLATARRIAAGRVDRADLVRVLTRHRFAVQGIGVVAIMITTMWGMWQNLNASAL
ncbi:MAG: component of SufBCD complex [Gemmobacter sp.]